jgi:hypothetical protein
VTTRDPPLLSRRDIEGYAADLGQAETEIFLQKGLDKPFRKTRSDLPVRQKSSNLMSAIRLLLRLGPAPGHRQNGFT